MGRVLAIDYGNKRVGLAVTDPLRMIANPLDTIHVEEVLQYITNYCNNEVVDEIVVGEPKQMNNEASQVEQHIKGFIKKLVKSIPGIKVSRVDERFTSKMAFQSMIDGGMKKKDRQNKENIDKISATIILQTYLDKQL